MLTPCRCTRVLISLWTRSPLKRERGGSWGQWAHDAIQAVSSSLSFSLALHLNPVPRSISPISQKKYPKVRHYHPILRLLRMGSRLHYHRSLDHIRYAWVVWRTPRNIATEEPAAALPMTCFRWANVWHMEATLLSWCWTISQRMFAN